MQIASDTILRKLDEYREELLGDRTMEVAGHIDSKLDAVITAHGKDREVFSVNNDAAIAYFHTHVRKGSSRHPSGQDMEVFVKYSSIVPEAVVAEDGVCIYNATTEFQTRVSLTSAAHRDTISKQLVAYYQVLKLLVMENIISQQEYESFFKSVHWSELRSKVNDLITKDADVGVYLFQP